MRIAREARESLGRRPRLDLSKRKQARGRTSPRAWLQAPPGGCNKNPLLDTCEAHPLARSASVPRELGHREGHATACSVRPFRTEPLGRVKLRPGQPYCKATLSLEAEAPVNALLLLSHPHLVHALSRFFPDRCPERSPGTKVGWEWHKAAISVCFVTR